MSSPWRIRLPIFEPQHFPHGRQPIPHVRLIGHKNPDADSHLLCHCLCGFQGSFSAANAGYVAARCGNSNARIDAILEPFSQSAPAVLPERRFASCARYDGFRQPHDRSNPEPPPARKPCVSSIKIRHHGSCRSLQIAARVAMGTLTLAATRPLLYSTPAMNRAACATCVPSLARIVESLKASVLHLVDESRLGRAFRPHRCDGYQHFLDHLGARQHSRRASHSLSSVIAPTFSSAPSNLSIRALIVSGNLPVDPAIVEHRPIQRACQHHRPARTTPPRPRGLSAPPRP